MRQARPYPAAAQEATPADGARLRTASTGADQAHLLLPYWASGHPTGVDHEPKRTPCRSGEVKRGSWLL